MIAGMAKEARDIITVHGGNAQSVNYMDERHYNSQQNKKSTDHGEPGMGIAQQLEQA